MSELPPKQERFCREYVIDLNGTQAAIRSGYAEKAAHVQASRLLSNDKVQARIEQLQAESAARTNASADDVVKMLLDSYDAATEAGQYGPAIRAAELLGRRHAMFRDVRIDPPEHATREELADALVDMGMFPNAEAVLRFLPPDPPPPSRH